MKQKESKIMGLFKKAARILVRRFPGKNAAKRAQTKRLLALTNGRDVETYETERVSKVLLVLAAGLILTLVAYVKQKDTQTLSEIERAPYGANSRQEVLTAQTSDGEEIGAYLLDLGARLYTKEQAETLFEEARALLPDLIRAENESLLRVTKPLTLPANVAGYPFRLSYGTDDYTHLKTDGTIQTDDLDEAGRAVTLTVQFIYGDFERAEALAIHLYPPVLDEKTLRDQEMREALAKADADSLYEEQLFLPEEVNNQKIRWTRRQTSSALLLAALTLVCAFAVFFLPDQKLKEQIRKREEGLQKDYPVFVSGLAMYLAAGMPLRHAMCRMAERGGSFLVLQDELRRVASWLNNSVPEATAYERFSARTGLPRYTKLATLLTQNLQKGTALIPLIRAEAQAACASRMDEARVRGEQTQTKLMVPMMLMLSVVMVLIMVPAFLSF